MTTIDQLPDAYLSSRPPEAINWAVGKALGYRHARYSRTHYLYEVTDDPADRYWAKIEADGGHRGMKVSDLDMSTPSWVLRVLEQERITLTPADPEAPYPSAWFAKLGDVQAAGKTAAEALCFVLIRAKTPDFRLEDVPAWVLKPHHDREKARQKLEEDRARFSGASPSP